MESKYISRPYLTKYEKIKLIGFRATQLSRGKIKPLIKTTETDPIKIARLELAEGALDDYLIIKRYLPNNKIENWSLKKLKR